MTKRKRVEQFIEENKDQKNYTSIEIGKKLGISTVWVRKARRCMNHDFNEQRIYNINDLIVYISQYIDGSRLKDDF